MKLRTDIFPKCPRDAIITYFFLLLIPTSYIVHLFLIIPLYHEIWSPAYYFHLILTHFLLFNVCTNLICIILSDTSIKGIVPPQESKTDWRYCTECEAFAPPRSWHCKICKICILQRDHHCVFASCCIGFHNQRYFLMLVFYMLITELYSSYYGIYLLKDHLIEDLSWYSILKFIFPVCTMFYEFNVNQFYILFVKLVFTGLIGNAILLHYQLSLMLRGAVTYERKGKSKYDLGKMKNVEIVLGKKWYLVWIAPLIGSQKPCDGINWKNLESLKRM